MNYSNEKELLKIVSSSNSFTERKNAIDKITNTTYLECIAKNNTILPDTRIIAINKLKCNNTIFLDIATNVSETQTVRMAAIRKINNPDMLNEVYESVKDNIDLVMQLINNVKTKRLFNKVKEDYGNIILVKLKLHNVACLLID